MMLINLFLIVLIPFVCRSETNVIPSMQPSVSISFMPLSSQIHTLNGTSSRQSPAVDKISISTFTNTTAPSSAREIVNNTRFSPEPSINNLPSQTTNASDSNMGINISSSTPNWASDLNVILTFSYKSPISATPILDETETNLFITNRIEGLIKDQAFDSEVRVETVRTSIVENYGT